MTTETLFYQANVGFFTEEVENSVPVTQDVHAALMEAHYTQNKLIIADENGYPILVERPPSDYHEWDGKHWVISKEKQEELLVGQRQIVREQINALRDRKINGGVYVAEVDKWFDTDATAERNILSVKATFDLFDIPPIAWTCADNSILMIDKAKLMVIWQALMTAKTRNHANALRHKEAVEQSDNPLAYDYSDGWTTSYQDYLEEQNDE